MIKIDSIKDNISLDNKVDLGINKKSRILEIIFEKIFLICASVSIISIFIISFFIFLQGIPAIIEIGLFNFIFGQKWQPSGDIFGIFPMIVGSLYVTFGSILIGVPIGIFTAIYIAKIANRHIAPILNTAIELLAGIPSVVYGFFGLMVIVPLIDKYLGGGGNSLLCAIIVLSIMILPTIIKISQDAIKAVPKSYEEGSLALGASKIQTIFKVVIPASKSGILTSIVLGIARAIGETMAVILVAGNTPLIPDSITDRVRTLTANIAIEMGYAYGLHQKALFATGVILFVFMMLLNLLLNFLTRKEGEY
ncbi:phosphate ABC transporter permease subunit PstC [Peptostreptococcaceae bacterium AGR-M142]